MRDKQRVSFTCVTNNTVMQAIVLALITTNESNWGFYGCCCANVNNSNGIWSVSLIVIDDINWERIDGKLSRSFFLMKLCSAPFELANTHSHTEGKGDVLSIVVVNTEHFIDFILNEEWKYEIVMQCSSPLVFAAALTPLPEFNIDHNVCITEWLRMYFLSVVVCRTKNRLLVFVFFWCNRVFVLNAEKVLCSTWVCIIFVKMRKKPLGCIFHRAENPLILK